MNTRVIKFSDWKAEKGMDDRSTVDYYDRLFSKIKFFYRRLAKKALRLKPDAYDIVDIGTGPGFLAIELAKQSGQKVKAVDISPNMLKKASENARKANVQVETIQADVHNLPFENNSIDLVTASYLIHFIEDINKFLSELKRIVRPGGKALIGGFHRDVSPALRLILDFGSRIFLRYKPIHSIGPVFDASFTKEEIEKYLRESGLDDFLVSTGLIGMQIIINF